MAAGIARVGADRPARQASAAPAGAMAHLQVFGVPSAGPGGRAGHPRLDGALAQIAERYELLRAAYENELDVEVTSAVALDAGQQGKLEDALKRRFSRDVRIHMSVDPALLGGAVIRAGDLVIDGSIQGRLQRLASVLDS